MNRSERVREPEARQVALGLPVLVRHATVLHHNQTQEAKMPTDFPQRPNLEPLGTCSDVADGGIGRRMAGAARWVLRLAITLGVVAGAAVAVVAGAAELERRAAASEGTDPAPTFPVSASPVDRADGYTVRREFIGQVEPQRSAAISFELPGRLAAIHVEEGDAVAEGTLLAAQDTSLLEAERMRLEALRRSVAAQLRFAKRTVERNETLNARGFASGVNVDEALARVEELTARTTEIDATLLENAVRVRKTQLRAPFAGRVTERLVEGGETVGAGQRVLGLVQLHAPRLRVGVPLDITAEALSRAGIAVDGVHHPARLLTLRPDVDPVTRTRTALFELDTSDPLTFGQIARLTVRETVEAEGAWVPMTSLKERSGGQWSVLAVGPDQVVRAAAVEILHAESDRVYVRGGIPDGTMLIDGGPQRVTAGQRVAMQIASNLD